MNQDNNQRNWAGTITGAVNFTRSGFNNFIVYSNNDYTGTTIINGGNTFLRDGGRLSGTGSLDINYATLTIDNNTAFGLDDRVNDSKAITLRGGSITFQGRAQTASSETLGAVALAQGNSTITVTAGGTNVNSADLLLTSLTRNAGGGTVNFSGTSGLIGSTARLFGDTFTQLTVKMCEAAETLNFVSNRSLLR